MVTRRCPRLQAVSNNEGPGGLPRDRNNEIMPAARIPIPPAIIHRSSPRRCTSCSPARKSSSKASRSAALDGNFSRGSMACRWRISLCSQSTSPAPTPPRKRARVPPRSKLLPADQYATRNPTPLRMPPQMPRSRPAFLDEDGSDGSSRVQDRYPDRRLGRFVEQRGLRARQSRGRDLEQQLKKQRCQCFQQKPSLMFLRRAEEFPSRPPARPESSNHFFLVLGSPSSLAPSFNPSRDPNQDKNNHPCDEPFGNGTVIKKRISSGVGWMLNKLNVFND